MIKRIYAVVTDKEFYLFRKAAYTEDMPIGEAITRLVIAFGKGEVKLPGKRKREKKKAQVNQYMADHEKSAMKNMDVAYPGFRKEGGN